MRSKSTY